jgi:hypothetical protein
MTLSEISELTIFYNHLEKPENMKNEYLKNREGRIIGRINGEWLLGRSGLPVARYVSSVDKTLTREGRVIGNGDIRLFQLGKHQPRK